MCGIVGFTGPPDPQVLRRMTDALRHRGPDGQGFWSCSAPSVHLGHRRLVVIDREGGGQPMITPDGRWVLSYNGEIYNHLELRDELAAAGVRFHTRSDVEVLLQALARWGEDALPRLDGMFAFAALDVREGRLLLAVDRFGQKPLVWTMVPDRYLVFASELSALRIHPAVPKDWDTLALCRYLAFDAPPAPQTILRDVQRLEAGTALSARLGADGRVLAHRTLAWWHPEFGPRTGRAPRPEEFVDALRASVRRHLVSDVPLGVLLSGGIDSTSVAAAAAEEHRPIITISMGFGERGYDESAAALGTARTLASIHHAFQLTPGQALRSLEEVTRHLDEPLADAGSLPAWELYRHARQRVTVALGGDGGDELLEGYPTYRALELARRWEAAGAARLAPWLGRIAALLPVGEGYYPFGYQARRFAAGLSAEPWYRLQVYLGACGAGFIRHVIRPEVLAQAGLAGDDREFAERLYEPAFPASIRDQAARLEPNDFAVWAHLRSFLAGEVLRKVDRMSMAHGLEVRAPMLGSPFAELCLQAPPAARRQGRTGKLPLRRWLGMSPLRAVVEPGKRGFAIPVARWLRHEFRAMGEDILFAAGSPLREWCQPERVKRVWRRHLDRSEDARKELWALMSLGLWLWYHPPSASREPVVKESAAHEH